MYRIGKEEIAAVERVITSGKLFKVNTAWQESMHAEEDLCAYMNVPHSIVMTSGHAALVSALVAAGVGPGDQVIVPAYTYIATAMAVVAAGAIPVIAEVDESMTIDPRSVEERITPSTKAIIPVHMLGMPCKMDEITEIARRHSLTVIEDACQADGASYKGRMLGTIGDVGAFSFNFFKIISAGEGGALVTKNRDLYQKALIYHDSSAVCFFGNQLDGVEVKPFCGNEYRTNEINSAILREQLKKLPSIIADLRRNKAYVAERLSSLVEIVKTNDPEGELATHILLRFETAEMAQGFAERRGINPLIKSSRHVFTDWDSIMNKRGHLNPLMDPFKFEANKDIIPDYKAEDCPRTMDLLSRTFSIPINPNMDTAQLDAFVEEIKAAL